MTVYVEWKGSFTCIVLACGADFEDPVFGVGTVNGREPPVGRVGVQPDC